MTKQFGQLVTPCEPSMLRESGSQDHEIREISVKRRVGCPGELLPTTSCIIYTLYGRNPLPQYACDRTLHLWLFVAQDPGHYPDPNRGQPTSWPVKRATFILPRNFRTEQSQGSINWFRASREIFPMICCSKS